MSAVQMSASALDVRIFPLRHFFRMFVLLSFWLIELHHPTFGRVFRNENNCQGNKAPAVKAKLARPGAMSRKNRLIHLIRNKKHANPAGMDALSAGCAENRVKSSYKEACASRAGFVQDRGNA
jgi:hypothetical protein